MRTQQIIIGSDAIGENELKFEEGTYLPPLELPKSNSLLFALSIFKSILFLSCFTPIPLAKYLI